ncbi:MAG: hypothetical protein NTY02_14350 [Acidobacteria bacterium]|nr:hypothetical protein [Acidobacteriota bacterium]
MRRLLIPGVFAAVLALAFAGCGGVTDPTTIGSTTTTETFAGILNPGGGSTHVFTVYQQGEVIAILTSVGDDNTRIVGVSLGNWSGTACNIAVANDNAYLALPLTATVSAAGTLCARVYDSKGVPDATIYTLSVTHP